MLCGSLGRWYTFGSTLFFLFIYPQAPAYIRVSICTGMQSVSRISYELEIFFSNEIVARRTNNGDFIENTQKT